MALLNVKISLNDGVLHLYEKEDFFICLKS